MNSLDQAIQRFLQEFNDALTSANSDESLEQVRVTFLGRHGQLTQLMGLLKDLSPEEKKLYGPQLNSIKQDVTADLETKKEKLLQQKIQQEEAKKASFDVTAYKSGQYKGSLHPYTHVIQHITGIVTSMGFEIADGPEIETAAINFEALNIPESHPARDMHDTFWLDIPGMLLRTHTSTVQIHEMQQRKPPIAIIAPGRCYRHEATDASHDYMFMQCEGMVIDKNISMANLFATTQAFLQALFEKKDLTIRIRPGYFPFVEPGVEIDMSCPFCTTGCSTCKKTRWIEICGAGLIHPNVLNYCGIDPEQYSGFAFGFGLTRLVMLKYGIKDIRYLHEGKIDFLKQF